MGVPAAAIAFLLLMQASPAVNPAFRKLADQATSARSANRLDEAVNFYRQALKLNPAWGEGWYFLGSILYEQDKGAECAAAFQRFTRLQPKVSAGFAFQGLCLFQARSYGPSLSALLRARQIGLPQGEQLTDVASYHAAMLYTKEENFERALQILQTFSARKQIDPKLVEAAGIAALRRPVFPQESPLEDRELVYRVGRAVMIAGDRRAAEAAELFREIVRDYPKTPNLHYTYGTLLLGGTPDEALKMFAAELEVQPGHVPSLVMLAVENVTRGNFAAAKPYGELAVKAAPNNFTTHVALGRALLGLDEIAPAIAELEQAARLEPTSPQVRIALASAYQKAGRVREAAQQRAEFQRLKSALEVVAR